MKIVKTEEVILYFAEAKYESPTDSKTVDEFIARTRTYYVIESRWAKKTPKQYILIEDNHHSRRSIDHAEACFTPAEAKARIVERARRNMENALAAVERAREFVSQTQAIQTEVAEPAEKGAA